MRAELPAQFRLHQNYPNPFNPATTITYSIPAYSHVTLDVYNINGAFITTLIDSDQGPGTYHCQWTGTASHGILVGSGIYVYRLQAGEFVEVKKMVLIK